MSKFNRPESLKFPQVYHTFKAKNKGSDEVVEYRIQDLLEADYKKALDLLILEFVPMENFCLCRGIEKEAQGMKEIREFWEWILESKISLACYKNDELVGLNFLYVISKDDEDLDEDLKSETWKDISVALEFVGSKYNVFESHKVDQFLTDCALVTSKDYRDLGIETEFLKARFGVMKALSINVTSTIFTTPIAQQAAVNAGYKEALDLKWSELGKTLKTFDFSKATTESCKVLDYKI